MSATPARRYPTIATLPLPPTQRDPLRLFQRVQLLPRVLDHRDRRDFDIGEFAVDLLGATNIDVLNNVTGCRIDLDLAAWTVGVLPFLEKIHCFVGGELTSGDLDQVEDCR